MLYFEVFTTPKQHKETIKVFKYQKVCLYWLSILPKTKIWAKGHVSAKIQIKNESVTPFVEYFHYQCLIMYFCSFWW